MSSFVYSLPPCGESHPRLSTIEQHINEIQALTPSDAVKISADMDTSGRGFAYRLSLIPQSSSLYSRPGLHSPRRPQRKLHQHQHLEHHHLDDDEHLSCGHHHHDHERHQHAHQCSSHACQFPQDRDLKDEASMSAAESMQQSTCTTHPHSPTSEAQAGDHDAELHEEKHHQQKQTLDLKPQLTSDLHLAQSDTETQPDVNQEELTNCPYLAILFVPLEYPEVAPSLRFQSILRHSQLTNTTFVPDSLIDHWLLHGFSFCDHPCLDGFRLDEMSDNNSLLAVVALAYLMLHTPAPTPPHPLESASEDELQNVWETHDPDCQCPINACMPCSFAELASISSMEAKALLLAEFRDNIQHLPVHMYDAMAELHSDREHIIAAWRAQTPDPFLGSSATTLLRQSFPAKPDRQQVFQLLEDWLDPSLLALLQDGDYSNLKHLVHQEAEHVYSLPFFQLEACNRLEREVQAFEASDLPKVRPNSMNNYGVVLDDIGLEQFFELMSEYVVQPLAHALLPLEVHGAMPLDSHHAFIVQYRPDQDRFLDMHVDDSEVTLNVNLSDQFQGSALQFCGVLGTPSHRKQALQYQHVKGRAVLHAGMQRHGADSISTGYRSNLILWCRASRYRMSAAWRQAHARHENEQDPDPICLSRTHDPDYQDWTAM
eukprot:m.134295 g.134295  ORF g.134295 m.134295 type:complete len:657 (-) comp15816_c0_seq1:165-2135(-)